MPLLLGRVPVDAIVLGAHLAGRNRGPLDPCGNPVHKVAVRVLQPDLHPGPVRDGRPALRICGPQDTLVTICTDEECCYALYVS